MPSSDAGADEFSLLDLRVVTGLMAGGNEIVLPPIDVGVTGENDPQLDEHWSISA